MGYLEDKYGSLPSPIDFMLDTPEERAFAQLLVRTHDLYISSPNCTQPGFSHTQGSMYLAPHETPHCSADRAMDRPTRAAKVNLALFLTLSTSLTLNLILNVTLTITLKHNPEA